MPVSLFVENYGDGLAFYINGELQFHTGDEQIYHEYLVVPAIALAVQRFGQVNNLRILICGGGDGLAAREALRFSQVQQIDLVDYNPEVIELGKTTFAPYNRSSLTNPKVKIHTAEALAFLSSQELESIPYHVIICDFTFPGSIEEAHIYSREWFQLLKSYLHPQGLITTNGVSSDHHTKAFWCIYQTLLVSELNAKPMQVEIPSFRRHGYGTWGFFLASDHPITQSELATITLPEHLQALSLGTLSSKFIFKEAIANLRYDVHFHSLVAPCLLSYLLNSLPQVTDESSNTTHNFLEIQETASNFKSSTLDLTKSSVALEPSQLEALAKLWLEKFDNSPHDVEQAKIIDLEQLNALLPVQHRYHTPSMVAEWLGSTKQLLSQIDLSRLLPKILERTKDLPPQFVKDVQELNKKLDSRSITSANSKISNGVLSPSTTKTASQVLLIVSLTLLFANIIAPDAVFGKGSFSSHGGTLNSSDDNVVGALGFVMTVVGVAWLWQLANPPNTPDEN